MRIWIWAACLIVLNCARATLPSSALVDDEAQTPPYAMGELPTLAATGFYAEASMTELAAGVQEYEPRFPLYSDTLYKRRFIYLPEGGQIDATQLELWTFPVGTKLWKEFRLGRGETSRILETRYMEKREGQWIFATYIWNEEQTEARLWSGDAIVGLASLRVPGPQGENQVGIDIPSYAQCLTCHIQHGATSPVRPDPVLGFSATQLELDVIRSLREQEKIGAIRLSQRAHAIPARNDLEKEVIGYMHANCGHCHNPRRTEFVPPLAGRHFALDYNIGSVRERGDIHLLQLVDRPPVSHTAFIPGVSPTDVRIIKAGDPNASMLFHRMSAATGAELMPKIGTASRDYPFLERTLRPWIQTLPRNFQ